jgi:hypothetical protein
VKETRVLTASSKRNALTPERDEDLVAYAEIWLMLMLMLICCERKTLFVG